MHSIVCHGKVFDLSYKKRSEGVYLCYVGTVLIGQAFKTGANNWTAVTLSEYRGTPQSFGKVEHLNSRFAVAWLLYVTYQRSIDQKLLKEWQL